MKKLTDKELDSLFKAAADGYQPVFENASWEAMSNKLDHSEKRYLWPKWLSLLLIGIFIFSVGVWVGTSIHTNKSDTQKHEVVRDELLLDKNRNSSAEESKDLLSSSESKVTPTESKNILYEKKSSVSESEKSSGLIHRVKKNEIAKPELFLNQDNYESFAKEEIIDDTDTQLSDSYADKVQINSIDSVGVDQELQVKQVPDSVLSQEGVKEENSEEEKMKPVFMRALVSPDFSSISFAPTQSIGTNYSLLLEYPIVSRLYISSGAILSKKIYSSDDEIVYGKYRADGVDGTCKILDIPINFYYVFDSSKKLSVYTGMGVSSYFMLDENYTFHVNTASGTKNFDWSFKSENIEWFKLLNLSVGVQYKLRDRFYVQAEPFIKAPLAGIGEWDIALSSWGVFFGLKYQLNK